MAIITTNGAEQGAVIAMELAALALRDRIAELQALSDLTDAQSEELAASLAALKK